MRHDPLTRRSFVQMAGAAAVAAQAKGLWAEPLLRTVSAESKKPEFAFVGVGEDAGAVHVYAMEGEQWKLLQRVLSESPVSLALHPSGHMLFVLNEVNEYQGLPCGSIEAYRIDEQTGQLDLLGRQGLSLSATMPRQLAVSPDGKNLAVAIHGGGAYNLLPILADGSLGRVHGILKETGNGPIAAHQETAHPQSVVFDSTGKRLIAADLGSDTVSVISSEDGLELRARYEMQAGSGPRHLALHPRGHLLYVANALDGSLSVLGYDEIAGQIPQRFTPVRGDYAAALAIHPTGDFLYSAGSEEMTVWRIDPATGALTRVQSRSMETGAVSVIMPLPNGREILALARNGIVQMKLDADSGHIGTPALVVSISGARSVAVA
jgi:6-phosphogluconolactonase